MKKTKDKVSVVGEEYKNVFDKVRRFLACTCSEYNGIPKAVTQDCQRVTQMKVDEFMRFNRNTGGTWESRLGVHTLQMMEYIHEGRLYDAEDECCRAIVFLMRCAVRLGVAQSERKLLNTGAKPPKKTKTIPKKKARK